MASQDLSLGVGTHLVGGTQQAFSAVANGMRIVAESIRLNATSLAELGKAAKSKSLAIAAEGMNKLATAAELQVANLEKLITVQESANKSEIKSASSIDKKTQALARASDALEKEAVAEKKAAKTAKELERANEREQIALKKKAELIQHLRVVYYQLNHSKDRYAVASRKIIANLQAGEIASKKAADGIVFLNKQRNTAISTAKRLNINLNELKITYHGLLTATGELSAKANSVIASFSKQKISAKEARAELRRLVAAYKETGNSQRGEALATRKLSSNIRKLSIRYRELLASSGHYSESFSRLTAQYRSGNLTLEQTRAELARLNRSYTKNIATAKRLSAAQQRVYTTFPKYGKQIAMLEKQGMAIKEQTALLHRYTVAQEEAQVSVGTFRNGITRLARSFKAYASYIVASSAIFAIIGIFRQTTQAIIEYSQALKDLQAITKSSLAATAAMGIKILKVAADTKFSATEIADSAKLLGQAGFSAKEIIGTLDSVATLATGTLTSMSVTVDLVTTAMRVFDIQAENSSHVADVFANAVNRSKLTIDKMRIAMNYIGPIANAAGISLEEVTAAMMTMANQGIRASTIGTGLRQVFRRLVDPSTALEKGLTRVGLVLNDINPQTHSLANILTKLQKVVRGNADAFRMFGRRGATAIIALTKKGGEGLLNLLTIVNRSGSAADMAATQMEGLGIAFKNLQDRIKNLYIAMGKGGLAGAMQLFVDSARGLVTFLTGVFNNSLVQTASKFMLIVGSAQLLIMALKWFAGTGFAKALFAPLITGLTAFHTAIVSTEISVNTLEASIAGLKAALIGFVPAALLISIVWLIQHVELFNEKLAGNVRELGAQKLELANNIDTLALFTKKLGDANLSYADQSVVITKLIDKYPELAEKITSAHGKISQIQIILDKFNKSQKSLLKEQTLEKLGLEFKLFQLQIIKANKDSGTLTQFWHRLTKGSEQVTLSLIKNKQELAKSSKTIANEFLAIKKKYPKVTLKQFLDRLLPDWGASGTKSEVAKRIQVIIDAEESAIKLGNKKLAGVTKKDILSLFGPEELKAHFKDLAAERDNNINVSEEALSKHIYKLSLLEAEGIKSHSDAEGEKLVATIAAYQDQLKIAKEYAAKITDIRALPEKLAADKKVLQLQKRVNQARLRDIQFFVRKEKAAEKSVTQAVKKENSEKAKSDKTLASLKQRLLETIATYNTTIQSGITAIDKRYARKRVDIETAAQNKIKDLLRKRKDTEQSTQADIASINDSIQDKILRIQQRGLKGFQKEASERNAANARLEKGIELTAKAKQDADKKELARAQKLIQKAGEYYESLKNNNAAINGLKAVGEALKNARKLQGKLALDTLSAQIDKVKTAEAAKLKILEKNHQKDLKDFKNKEAKKLETAKAGINARIKLEETRHRKAMSNLEAEIRLLKQKLGLVRSQAAASETYTRPQQQFATGGEVIHMATGGRLPGADSQEDLLTVKARKGEWFIRNESARHWTDSIGSWFMNAVNAPSSLSGKHLESLLGMNSALAARSLEAARNISAGVGNKLQDLGIININLPTEGPPIPALMNPMDAAEFVKQLNNMQRLSAS